MDFSWVSDAGLPSVAVVALVIVIGYLFRLVIRILDTHSKERADWNKSEDKRTEKMSEAVSKLTNAVDKLEESFRDKSKNP